MNEIEGALDLDSKDGDRTNLESEAAKVELGDNFTVIFDEFKHGDPFYVVLCNKLLHRCEQSLEVGGATLGMREK